MLSLGFGVICYSEVGNWNCSFSKISNEVYLLLAHTVSVYAVLLFQKTY